MGEIIEFPYNNEEYDKFIQLGNAANAQHQVMEALLFFEQAYAMRRTFSVNLLLVNCCLEIGDMHQALCYITNDYPSNYMMDDTYFDLYIHALLGNQLFLATYTELEHAFHQSVIGEEKYRQLSEKTLLAEEAFQTLYPSDVRQAVKQLSEIGQLSFMEQMTRTKQMEKLPQSLFIETIKPLLVNPAVYPLVRNKLLEELILMGISMDLPVLTLFGEVKTVCLSQVSKPETAQQYQALQQWLRRRLEDENPILLSGILEELQMVIVLLYPFIDDEIDSVDEWGESYLIDFGILEEPNDYHDISGKKEIIREELMRMTSTDQ